MPGADDEVAYGSAPWLAAVAARLPNELVAIDEEGRVLWVNAAMAGLLGYPADELVGRSMLDFLHPDDLEVAFIALALAIAHPESLAPETYRVRRRDGTYTSLEAVGAAHLDDADVRAVLISSQALNHRASLDAALVAIANGEAQPAMAHLLDSMAEVFERAPCGIVHGDSYRREVAGVLVPFAVDPGAESGAERQLLDWLATVEKRTPVAVASLPAFAVGPATEAGFGAVAVVPVPDPASDSPAIVVCWTADELLAGRAVERIDRLFATVLRLALERRHQIAELEKQTDALTREARSDALTGLANRAALFEHLARADAGPRTVLYIDLDDFKAVNDTRSHAVGDELLGAIAARLRQAVRPDDLIARLGGDEFAVVLPGVGEPDRAEQLATRVLATVAEPADLTGGPLTPRLSIGVAVDPTRKLPGPALLDVADRALYRAKHLGKNRVVLTVVEP